MPRIRKQIREVMSELDSRGARMRPGSVLILVVVLLVLMALLGTAYLVTARNERVATRLYSHNVQIDLLVKGVENMAIAALSDTSYQTSDAQHYDDWYTTSTTPIDGGGTPVDHSFLAARIPVVLSPDGFGSVPGTPRYPVPKGAVVQINGAGQPYMSLVDNNATAPPGAGWVAISGFYNISQPIWPAVSGPLAVNCYNEDPRYPTIPPGQPASPRPDGVRTCVTPSFVSFGGKNYPAFQYYSFINKAYERALAASASGNGIADAFLWRLPIGTIDGITYYAAVRIIDNNSAVNVNTAMSSGTDFNFDGSSNTTSTTANLGNNPAFAPGIFPSGIGLAELTNSYTGNVGTDSSISPEMLALNQWRFNYYLTNQSRPQGIAGSNTTPVENGAARMDFNYLTVGDALFQGIARRVNNPGQLSVNTPFQTFSWGDATALANRFDVPNPNASPTYTEQSLVNSTWNSSGTPGNASAALRPTFQATPWDPSTQTWSGSTAPRTDYWFNQYLEGAPAVQNRRAYFTTRNPLSNLMPVHPLIVGQNELSQAVLSYMIPPGPNTNVNYANGPAPKVSLNTADVAYYDLNPVTGTKGPTLWYGFYQAMQDVLPSSNSPNANANVQQVAQGTAQFRSSIRDSNAFQTNYVNATTWFTGQEMVLLRSLLASVNAKDLRDSGDNAEVCRIPLFPATSTGFKQSAGGTVNVVAYGTERQVFITEVYVNGEVNPPQTVGAAQHPQQAPMTAQNPKGYVAVEIYNPYDYPVDMSWWTLVVVKRTPQGGGPQVVTARPLSKFNGFANGDSQNALLPPHQYMILQNLPPMGVTGMDASSDAQYMPSNMTTNGAQLYYVPDLTEAIQGPDGSAGELVLLRQPNAHGGDPANNTDPKSLLTPANIPGTLAKFAPVDSFDFTGMQIGTGAKNTTIYSYHYVRANPGANPGTITTAWKFVYPGRWDPTPYKPFLQEGIEMTQWTAPDPMAAPPIPAGQYDPWVDAPPSSASGQATPIALGMADANPSYLNPFGAIQLNNTDMGGPHKLFTTQTPYTFPFGGFPRIGDVLQVPYIGSYMVFDSTGTQLLEMNPVTRDCACADDNDGGRDDSIEQVGRFCPLTTTAMLANGAEAQTLIGPTDLYAWANHVLDYFTTIQNPNDDYTPNVDPTVYPLGPWNMPNLVYSNTPTNPYAIATPVANTLNSGNGPNKGYEDTVPVEGLININTASWRTLAAIPWISVTQSVSAATAQQGNVYIAKAIVNFRNTYGPFKTIFDLNKVPGLQTYATPTSPAGTYDPRTMDLPPALGNMSPLWQTTPPYPWAANDNVMNDFEGRFGMITRVSNLITTRSDTFTVYVLVQGWSGVGTAAPSLVVQRRAAFIADRSQLTPTNPSINVTPIQAY